MVGKFLFNIFVVSNNQNNYIMLNEIKNILTTELPKESYLVVSEWKGAFGGRYIKIGFAPSHIDINNVRGQKPQLVSLNLDLDTLELETQVFGGNGGGHITRQPDPNNPKESYLAMKSVKVPFRRPKKDKEAVLRAVKRFAQNYLKTLKANVEVLNYQDLVDYKKYLENIK